MLKTSSKPFTTAQLKAKLLRDNDCLLNALIKLLDNDEESAAHDLVVVDEGDREFLNSLRDQAIWRQRDHERGINLQKPLLTARQLFCLRRSLTETYLETLYAIAVQRLAAPHIEPETPVAEPEVSGCSCHQIPYSEEPTICPSCDWDLEAADSVSQSWFCTVCDGLAVVEHCGLRYCRAHYDEKRSAEASVDPYDLRNLNSLPDGEEGR